MESRDCTLHFQTMEAIEHEKNDSSVLRRIMNLFTGLGQRDYLHQEAEMYRRMMDGTADEQSESHLLQEASLYEKNAGFKKMMLSD